MTSIGVRSALLMGVITLASAAAHDRQTSNPLVPGEADPRNYACEQKDTPSSGRKRCKGYPDADAPGGRGPAVTASFLRSLDNGVGSWGPGDGARRRLRAGTGTGTKLLKIEAITDPRSIALKELTNRGLVLARVSGSPKGPEVDYRYGIGANETLADKFYFVVTKFAVNRSKRRDASYEIGKWELYGINSKSNSVVKVSAGSLHFCDDTATHPASSTTARFTGCRVAHWLASLESRLGVRIPVVPDSASSAFKSLNARLTADERKFLIEAQRQSLDAPAWVLCGTGCCTFEAE